MPAGINRAQVLQGLSPLRHLAIHERFEMIELDTLTTVSCLIIVFCTLWEAIR